MVRPSGGVFVALIVRVAVGAAFLCSIALACGMPYARPGARPEQRAAVRARWLAELRWSVAELAVLERAERLRSYGAGDAAADLVVCATRCHTGQRCDCRIAHGSVVGPWQMVFCVRGTCLGRQHGVSDERSDNQREKKATIVEWDSNNIWWPRCASARLLCVAPLGGAIGRSPGTAGTRRLHLARRMASGFGLREARVGQPQRPRVHIL